ncbi:hypothetical protein PIB30_035033 [Stylosanthes scabra]|uniref:Uncharacterized protein n=1 Tax=Stylosanthes scabra TaxID=79078 RepID=A0ABU6WBD3_9FABA|nr:hypothetical protein [Stylosanthes scabra]
MSLTPAITTVGSALPTLTRDNDAFQPRAISSHRRRLRSSVLVASWGPENLVGVFKLPSFSFSFVLSHHLSSG